MITRGPNWIHGTDNNPMLSLAESVGSKLSSSVGTTNVYDSKGVLMNSQEVLNGFEVFWEIVEDAFKYSNENCEGIASNLSLKDFFQERLESSLLDEKVQNTILQLAEMWGGFIGDLFERQSLKWVWLEECLDGGRIKIHRTRFALTIASDDLFVSDTHQAIITRMTKAIDGYAQIHLSTAVQSIESSHQKKKGEKVLVKTTSGNFGFDEVIVTIPLGALKMGKPQFIPKLPPELSCAITGASYSQLEKTFITFPTAFWEPLDPMSTNSEETKPECRFPVFTHFLHPTYVPEEQKTWTLEMVALSSSAVFGVHAKPVLLFYLWGTSAAQLTTAINTLTPSSPEYYNAIDTLFRPFYSRLPNYKEDCPDCVPSAVLATNWQNDEFAGNGSYTNFKTPPEGAQGEGDPMIDDGVRSMRKGIPERGIWFAGEHTAPFVALGTSTGAYWSGEATAIRVIEAYMSLDLLEQNQC